MTGEAEVNSLLHQQLDEYRLEAVLGRGGMARIYRGFDVRLNRKVAIKVIDAPFRTDPDYIVRFEREAQAIARLKHPHIVTLYRYGEADGLLYLAMEYIEGADLAAILAGYRADQSLMPAARAGQIIRPICLALDYAHQQGVVHRDVKPSNIMVDPEGRPVLTDFGLALLDNRTRGEIFGTPHYMAPEQVVSSAGATPQSDLYSIGVILFEIFTGKLPFDAVHPHELAMLHLTEPPPPLRQLNPALSPELEAVVLKALAKTPEERFPGGAALADALDQALQSQEKPQPRVEALPSAEATAGPEENSRVAGPAAVSPPPLPAGAAAPAQPSAKKGQLITTHYLLKNIRALFSDLTLSLTEEELRQLCVDLIDFKPVHHQLAQSNGKAEIIDRLLEYAEQTLQLDELLALAKELNPALYEKHQPYYGLASISRRDLVGRSLGQYHLVERLGQGGMADVYKAYQPSLARYVAVKVIHSHLANDEEFLERFEREAIAVAGLHHPNIVQVFDFAREDDLYYMVMEFVDGATLEAELKSRRERQELLPLAETVTLFQALASAIDYAHSRNVIHRDIKPGNIMFTSRQRVVLTDFGIARLLTVPSYTTRSAVLGTPAYMSPEQAQGEPVDERSDIYSLGVILYELVTGRIPFEGDNPVAIILKLATASWPPPSTINPNLPRPVERVILKAMHKNSAGRYRTAGEMAQALRQALDVTREPRALNRIEDKNLDRPGSAPEIEVNLPAPGPGQKDVWEDLAQAASGPVNLSNTGQVAFGGQNIIQIGSISGGQVSLGLGSGPPQSGPPSPPGPDNQRAAARQQLNTLRVMVESNAPPEQKKAALERVDELSAALTAAVPDLDTAVYVRNWFARNIPALAEAVIQAITHPAVGELMVAAGETVAAEFRQRFRRF